VTNIQAAKEIRRVASDFRANASGPFAKRLGMVKSCKIDAKSLDHIAELLENREIVKASRAAEKLDTFVRESISETVWDYLHRRRNEG